MNIENTQVQMRKGILEFCILHIISRGEVYASDMLEELTSAKIMVVEGTLYPLLTRLRKANLVDYQWVESESGPPRKYYTLTEKGKDLIPVLIEVILWSSKYKNGLHVSQDFLAKLSQNKEEIIEKITTCVGTTTFSSNQ